MFTAAYSAFHQQYPNITIVPREGVVRDLQRLISQGDLDIGFLTLTDMDRTNDVYETIYREELFLAIPSIHLLRFYLLLENPMLLWISVLCNMNPLL